MNNNDPDESDESECSLESSAAGCSMNVEENVDMTGTNTDKRPYKRNREGDKEEMWTTVGRKGKRFARAEAGEPIPEDRYEICMTGSEQLPKQFKLAKLLQTAKIQHVTRIKYINSYKVLIQFNNEDSAEEFINSKTFQEMGYKMYKTMEMTHTYGVIKDIDLEYTDEEILESLSCNIQILGIKSLKRRNRSDGKWEICEKMRICFKGSSLPPHVKIFDTIAEVSPYMYPVTQCSRCWRFGHSTKICPSYKIVCPKCGDNHPNCTKTTFKCNNCGGKHMAMARICPIRCKEKRIRELMIEFGVSYKKAITLYVPPSPPPKPEPVFTEEDFPKPNKEYQDESGQSDPSAGKKSYAEATKKTGSKEKKKKKKEQRSVFEDINWGEESETSERMETSEQEEEHSNQEETTEKKEDTTWKALLKKLKEKILERNLTWEEKIKTCWKILYSGIVSMVVKYLADWPGFKLFNLNGP
ncbi:uncharacterized protein LOC123864730 [Maniola jurtina]|uniref:uncharacterized protein LOC123864730 n=1 Tax=Maniola jurtina TaxID=191418 RepID=UPI001E68E32E|nr:uncharacterized protein LOC123864730 [Maniola jurtina]